MRGAVLGSWDDIVSGRRRGLPAACARSGLLLASLPYAAVVRARNFLFDAGLKRSERAAVPVFSVGNLSVGGTGKTPFVEWLVAQLLALGERPGILSRGYGARPGTSNDEARLLAENLTDVPHVQQPDRVEGARRAVAQGVSCLVLDDGFQHRRLSRDLDIVLIDSSRPFGHGYLLPRGGLREGLAGLRRADWVITTRGELLEPVAAAALHARLTELIPAERLLDSKMRAVGIDPLHQGDREPVSWLRGRKVFLAAGIGNPRAFEANVRRLGAEITGTRWFPDHSDFSAAQLAELEQASQNSGAQTLLVTQKDAVKLRPLARAASPIAVLRVELAFGPGQERFLESVRAVFARQPVQESP